ncbi:MULTISPECIES: hypothetical protein [Pseudomonas]|uniref:Uncharacterized protein n=4 Tax=Pseudomonas syringae group TaxID=136849 RepID=A0A0P9VAC9_PSESS|nr:MULTISPECIES: hypothetical protein [Pseudomonas]ARD12742.1 hypothetical protein PSA3335_17790 [Pseudomonas savastanoi pv. savastanoi NCPPB 3335]KAA3533337.1 hypothetical protein DXU85_27240 [Pseudomonas savastanoi]KPY00209.1 Uncharacterized protein ALO61_02292 [Pseudomonas savastanoi pv. nerii]KPY34212.1 Uncharacterized protein ALO49_01986 [Pseudomonas savastanoi pv. retacarpa]KPY64460.1 Uncharacterized protein ALO58_02050 [Pseudomonas savastanoi pv. savastanoi]
MTGRRLALPEIETYRYAVFCCSFKYDLSSTPDHALALFVDLAMAKRYGAWMWPSTFEVVDVVTGQPL